MSMTMGSPASTGRSEARWWGMAPLGPAATMVSKLRESAPSSRMVFSIRQAICRSVSPGCIVGVTASMALSDISMTL